MKRNIIFSILFTYIFWGCSGSSSSHSDEHEHQHSDHIEAHDHNHDEHEGQQEDRLGQTAKREIQATGNQQHKEHRLDQNADHDADK